jgi:hypothetical protein
MFHKIVPPSLRTTLQHPNQAQNPAGLALVRTPASKRASSPASAPTHRADLVIIAARRCSSFFAEAAVLVLVFGILDLFMLKGRIDLSWIVGALAISILLLAASIATDFSAHRWIKAHP